MAERLAAGPSPHENQRDRHEHRKRQRHANRQERERLGMRQAQFRTDETGGPQHDKNGWGGPAQKAGAIA
jgi:hypothetical protein